MGRQQYTLANEVPTPGDIEWRTDPQPRVPLARFGKDHWTTFGYVETRAVDHDGFLGHDQMRCNARLHPMLYAAKGAWMTFDGGRAYPEGREYPTRLKTPTPNADGLWGVEELHGHDDYTCLDDLIAAGLLTVEMPRPAADGDYYVIGAGKRVTSRMVTGHVLSSHGDVPRPSFTTGMDELRLMAAARWSLTPAGALVASQYRQWRAEGRGSHQFQPALNQEGVLR